MHSRPLHFFNGTAIVILLLAIIFCSPALAADEVLEVGGTGSALGTMRLLGRAFEVIHPHIRVHVQPSIGSSGAIKAVSKGALDIGLISRDLKDGEKSLSLSVIAYARTPFILVAGRNVPVEGLKTDELARIYRGEQLNWPKGERIRPVLRPESETDTELAGNISPGMKAAMDAARLRPGMLMALTDQDCLDIIEKTPGSLGFSTLAQVTSEKHNVKILALDGIVPDAHTLASGAYPYAKTLSLVTKQAPSAAVRRFVDFIQSPEGEKVLHVAGNITAPKALTR